MTNKASIEDDIDYQALADQIKHWGSELGFAQIGITDVDLSSYEPAFTRWLEKGYHADMDYMERHGLMRARPNELMEGSIRVISARMNYLPSNAKFAKTLKHSKHAFISRYALGRDYHKLLRKRLKQLGEKISVHCEKLNFRPFVDSAPILERPLAEKAGLGWIGKHTLLINEDAGSWFFLGEILVNIPLPCDEVIINSDSSLINKGSTRKIVAEQVSDNVTPKNNIETHNKCGSCVACIKICPTGAIVAPYVVDAKRCISYLTIEHKGVIPVEYRAAMGNRIYGCDDCQLICPWNKFAPLTNEQDFQARQSLDDPSLLTLFSWDEKTFLSTTEGSPIRRIGYQSWIRNIAISLGNVKIDTAEEGRFIIQQLTEKLSLNDEIINIHINWAIEQLTIKLSKLNTKEITIQTNERLTARLVRSIEKGLPRDA